jgi:hypothetical protein
VTTDTTGSKGTLVDVTSAASVVAEWMQDSDLHNLGGVFSGGGGSDHGTLVAPPFE